MTNRTIYVAGSFDRSRITEAIETWQKETCLEFDEVSCPTTVMLKIKI